MPLPEKNGKPLLPPHPHFLLAGTARQIGDWAVQSEPNKLWLLEAIKGGNDGLLKLAVEVTRLSLEDARRIHKSKLDIINPLSRILDWEVGPGYQGRKLEDDEVELMTICEDVEQALHNYVIYCELFHHNVDTALEPSLPIEWMAYCVPDSSNERNQLRTEFQLADFVALYKSNGWVSYTRFSELFLAKSPYIYGHE